MFGIGAGEFVVILIVALIVFGPSKLPEVGRAIGKGLREFRKAQAALSATLNEPDEPPIKSSSATTADDLINSAKERPLAAESSTKSSPVTTADDLINLAKERPGVKENHHEKIFNGNPDDAPADDARTSVAGARGSSNGVGEQSKPSADGTINPGR